jgi:hypothetical protein
MLLSGSELACGMLPHAHVAIAADMASATMGSFFGQAVGRLKPTCPRAKRRTIFRKYSNIKSSNGSASGISVRVV